jgi:hypothetical protein
LFVKRWSTHGGDRGYSIGEVLDRGESRTPDGDTVDFAAGSRRARGHEG